MRPRPAKPLDRRVFLTYAAGTVAALAAACVGDDKDTGGNSDADTDSDTDADSDVDVDTDSDVDSDVDADSDADSDTDADTDTDSGTDDCAQTGSDIEGPFYVEGVPIRNELDLYGEEGTYIYLHGTVTDTACVPIEGAVVEIWAANPAGAYDNDSEEMRYRGQIATGADGKYWFGTLKPGWYLNGAQYRPSHIHMKVWIDGNEALTTQIYFEGDPYIDIDPWASEAEDTRVIPLVEQQDGSMDGQFDVAVTP